MNNFPNLLSLLLLIVLIVTPASAQNAPALDAKNGFRDAKLGMPLSSFKGLKKDVEVSEGTYTFYNRPTDKLKIGDIDVKEIAYRFYHNKLSAVIINAQAGEGYNLSTTFSETYGKPRTYQLADDPEGYKLSMAMTNNQLTGLVWEGRSVKMIMWFGIANSSEHNFRDCTVVISSKAINAEVKRDENNLKRQKINKRTADL